MTARSNHSHGVRPRVVNARAVGETPEHAYRLGYADACGHYPDCDVGPGGINLMGAWICPVCGAKQGWGIGPEPGETQALT
jgi:hypothetical protein